VTTRGVFHRQAPFVESGGRYSPGSAIAAPPFGDVATAGWRSHATLGLDRSSPVSLPVRPTRSRPFAPRPADAFTPMGTKS
jgi:hypothetical protein